MVVRNFFSELYYTISNSCLAMQSFRDIVVSFEPLKDHVEQNKCNFRASSSSASMIVVFLSYATKILVEIFLL